MFKEYQQWLMSEAEKVWAIAQNERDAFTLLVLSLLFFIWGTWCLARVRYARKQQERRVFRKRGSMAKRDDALTLKLGDGITDMIENWYFNGEITIRERNRMYSKLARKLNMFDLARRKKKIGAGKAMWLKAEITARRAVNKLINNGKPVPIPGKPPLQVIEPKVKKESKFFRNKKAA